MDASPSIFQLLLFITSFILLVQSGLSYKVTDPPIGSPTEFNFAERPLSSYSYEKYLNNCAAQVYPICGEEIFSSVFFGNQTYSNECCFNLMNDLGKRCLDDLVKHILSSPKFYTNKISIWQRSAKVWNDCASISQGISPVEATYYTSVLKVVDSINMSWDIPSWEEIFPKPEKYPCYAYEWPLDLINCFRRWRQK